MSKQVTDFKEVQSQLDQIERVDAAMSIQAAMRGAKTRKELRQATINLTKPEAIEIKGPESISSDVPTGNKDENGDAAPKEEILEGETFAPGIATSVSCEAPLEVAHSASPDEDDLEPLAGSRDVLEDKQQNVSILEEKIALEQSVKLSAGAKSSPSSSFPAKDFKSNTTTWPEVEESFELPGGTMWPHIDGCSDSDVFSWVHETCQVFVRLVTWNLMSSLPSSVQEVQKKLLPKKKFHMYVIGTEECERSIAQSAINTNKDKWEQFLKEALGPDYSAIRSHTLQATHLIVFLHRALLPLVSDIRSSAVATGVANTLGNKGGIGIRLKLGNSRFLFVNAHLAANQNAVAARNTQFHKIERELSNNFSMIEEAETDEADNMQNSANKKPKTANYTDISDRTFFMGDLNYRIRGNREIVQKLIELRMMEVLIKNDQLRWSMEQRLLPDYFTEGNISFQPTYKYDVNSDVYDSGPKRRTPGWTDRILFIPNGIENLVYGAVQDLRVSDHRPVYGSFVVDIDCDEVVQPEFNEHGNHGVDVPFTKDSQVCSIM